MEFLHKLYDNEYFGIGLFIVISFLVISFLIVLFFGKKDEKKRKLEETNKLNIEKNDLNAFAETSVETPVEMPVPPIAPVAPINYDNETQIKTETINTPIVPIEPVGLESMSSVETEPVVPITPVAPVNYDNEPQIKTEIINTPIAPIEPVGLESMSNIVNEPVVPITPVAPVNYDNSMEEKTGIINMPVEPVGLENISNVVTTPIEQTMQPAIEENIIKPEVVVPALEEINVTNTHDIEPVSLEPIRFEIPKEQNNEPVKPNAQIVLEPLIKEDIEPIITHIEEVIPNVSEVKEVEIPQTYYEPIQKTEVEDIKVPAIDFDTLAETISKELDELERNTANRYEKSNAYNTMNNQFSSVYVSEPVKQTVSPKIDMPTKIELPSLKSDEIEPESYNI